MVIKKITCMNKLKNKCITIIYAITHKGFPLAIQSPSSYDSLGSYLSDFFGNHGIVKF